MPTPPQPLLRLPSLLCAIVLAATMAACGDNDDSGANISQSGSTQSDTRDTEAEAGSMTEQPATDEGQIRSMIAVAQDAFKTGDGKALCDQLTAAGQRDMVRYGSVIGIAGDCAKVAEGVADYNRKVGLKQRRSKVVAVRVRGDSATAIMRVQGSGALRQGFKKIDGQWRQLPYGLAKYIGAPQ